MERRKPLPQQDLPSSEFVDLIEKYGGRPEFVAKLRGDELVPARRETIFSRVRNAVVKRIKRS